MAEYKGKVTLKSVQAIEAPVKAAAGKKPVVKKGGDLRTKGGK